MNKYGRHGLQGKCWIQSKAVLCLFLLTFCLSSKLNAAGTPSKADLHVKATVLMGLSIIFSQDTLQFNPLINDNMEASFSSNRIKPTDPDAVVGEISGDANADVLMTLEGGLDVILDNQDNGKPNAKLTVSLKVDTTHHQVTQGIQPHLFEYTLDSNGKAPVHIGGVILSGKNVKNPLIDYHGKYKGTKTVKVTYQ